MPLFQSGSKKAMSKNIKSEMDAGKPQKQAIAVAYSVQRKNKRKKMADGGVLSAKDEQRPMPENQEMGYDKEETLRAHPSKKEQLSAADESRPSHDQEFNDKEDLDGLSVHEKGPQSDNWKNDFMRTIDDAETPEDMMMMLARGGYVTPLHTDEYQMADHDEPMEDGKLDTVDEIMQRRMGKKYAEGGEVDDDDKAIEDIYKRNQDEYHRRLNNGEIRPAEERKLYSDGGEVNIDLNGEEQANSFYKRNEDEVLKENYDSDLDDVSQPRDSNLKGDEREESEENEHDDVDSIRKRMKSRKAR